MRVRLSARGVLLESKRIRPPAHRVRAGQPAKILVHKCKTLAIYQQLFESAALHWILSV